MENELTPRLQISYSKGRAMDENDIEISKKEVPSKKEEAGATLAAKKKEDEAKAKQAKVSQEQQDKARKAWERKFNREIKGRGMDIPESERKKMEVLIEAGVMPVGGGATDVFFENFTVNVWRDERLKELANEIRDRALRDEVTEERLQEIEGFVRNLVGLGGVSESEGNAFMTEIGRRRIQRNAGQEYGEVSEDSQEQEPSDDLGFGNMRSLARDLTDSTRNTTDTLGAISELAEELLQPYSYIRSEMVRKNQELKAILRMTNDIPELQRRLNRFINDSVEKRRKNIAEGKEEVPQEIVDIQGLARFIMSRQESALYGRGKKYALLESRPDPRTGEMVDHFRPDNFLIWVRDQIIQLHDDNPASEMQPLSAVAIETQFKNINIYTMNRFRGQYFRDEVSGQIMNELAEEAVNMCYLFGFFRNMDLAYKQAMKSDSDLAKRIADIHAKNDVTRGNNWASFLSMPDKFSFGEDADSGGEAVSVKDTKVGDAVLIANDIYYNLSDIDEIIKVVGKDSAFLTKEGFKRALFLQQILGGQKYEWDEGPDNKDGFYDKARDNFYFINLETGEKRYIFNNDGSLNRGNFLTFVNFQNEPTANKSKVDFVRDLVQLSIAEKVGIDTGFASNSELSRRKEDYEKSLAEKGKAQADSEYKRLVKASRINAQFAEYSSYIEQRPLMIAARNDINRRGYDAATKLNALNYFVRQSGENTAGPIGNPEFLKEQIIKNLAVDFVAGLKTENGKSPYEIFHQIRQVMNDSSLTQEQKENQKAALMSQLRFQEDAAVDYTSNGVLRAFEIFHQVGEEKELGLDKIVTRSYLEGIKFHTAEFEKSVKDEFIKPLRYAFSSNSAIKYGSMYRGFERMENGAPIYKEKVLADHMFGDIVMHDIREDALSGKLKVMKYDEEAGEVIDVSERMDPLQRYQEYLNTAEARTRIVKNVARARIAAEIKHHRERWGPAKRWNADMINKFILALETMKALEFNEHGEVVETDRRFFSDEDIGWIRQNSGTGYKTMILTEGGGGLLKGVSMGIFSSIKDFFEDIFK